MSSLQLVEANWEGEPGALDGLGQQRLGPNANKRCMGLVSREAF